MPLLSQTSVEEQHRNVGEQALPVLAHCRIFWQVPSVRPEGMTHSVPAQQSPGAPLQVPPSGWQPGPQTPCALHTLEQHWLALVHADPS